MAKKFTYLKLKTYDKEGNEGVVNLTYRLGPKGADLFQSVAKVPMTSKNIQELGIKGIVYMVYAGCQAMHHDLTVDKVWELVDNYELEELGEIMNQISPESTEGEQDPNDLT